MYLNHQIECLFAYLSPDCSATGRVALQVGRPPGQSIVSGTLLPDSSMLALAGRAYALFTAAGGATRLAQAQMHRVDSDGAGPVGAGPTDSDGGGSAGSDPVLLGLDAMSLPGLTRVGGERSVSAGSAGLEIPSNPALGVNPSFGHSN